MSRTVYLNENPTWGSLLSAAAPIAMPLTALMIVLYYVMKESK